MEDPTRISGSRENLLGEWRIAFSADLLPAGEWEISAWAYDALSGGAYRLRNSFAINKAAD